MLRWRTEQLEYSSYQIKRKVRIQLADKKNISSETFREAASHSEITSSRIVGFEMELGNGDTRCELSIGRISGVGADLKLSVYGDNRQEREELFNALLHWGKGVQAPGWQRLWNRFANYGGHWVVGLIAFGLIGVVDFALYFASSHLSPYTAEAHALLAKGVTSNDLTKAIEFILALESNYNPAPRVATWGAQKLQLAIVIFCVMLSIRPHFEVGLGRGRERIARWNVWTRIVAVSLPLFVISTVAGNLLLNLLHLH